MNGGDVHDVERERDEDEYCFWEWGASVQGERIYENTGRWRMRGVG